MTVNCQTEEVKEMVFFDNMTMHTCLPGGRKQLGLK